MNGHLQGLFACGLLACLTSTAPAQLTVYTGLSGFQEHTGAVAEPPIPNAGLVGRTGAVFTTGRLTFSVSTTDPNVALLLTDFNAINPGNEIVMSSIEDLDVGVNSPVHALGFFFVEGTDPLSCNAACPCMDATFEVTLLLAGTPVGSFTFNAPDDTLAFYGVSSVHPFDHVSFRDLSRGCDNEYWGRFYLADNAPCSSDFNGDGDVGTDQDIEAFFACLAGTCCPACGSADFNNDGDVGTDQDIEAFFRVLAGGAC